MADVPPLYVILPGEKLPSGGAQEVGNKAFNLMRMAAAGLPVPPGFVLPVAWCSLPRETDANAEALRAALAKGVARIESSTQLGFSSARRPLLVSVRSGAALSMPGMMETVLDVGLNLESVDGLIRVTGNPRLAWDSFRRLVQGFAEVVAGLAVAPFDALVRDALASAGAENERELDHRTLRDLTQSMLRCYQDLAGESFPTEPRTQLARAVEAVFRSWDAPKAKSFRTLKGIPGNVGTAVTVQTMVYGNAGGKSGAGVGFTRNPASGAREFYYDFQFNSQGEDVVAGRQVLHDNARLRATLPEIWRQLDVACHELELLFGDAQDFEFTVQSGILWFLQSRHAKRTPWALVRIAVDMVEEGLCQPAEALQRLAEIDLNLVERTFFALPLPPPLANAQVASIGVACGAIALDSASAKRMVAAGQPVILVRQETSTADIDGLAVAEGVVTATGGRTSHAAVVARQLGKVCLVSCPGLMADVVGRAVRIGERRLVEGEFLSIDGNDGAVYPGRLTVVTERPERELAVINSWRAAANSATASVRLVSGATNQ
ncbi:MAG: PEP/pyruvate-binding domain-containing protein [Acetobacteraceae bacterium]